MRFVGLMALAEGEKHFNCYILFYYVIYAVCVVCAGFVVIENTLLIALHVNLLLVCTVSQTSDVYGLHYLSFSLW